MESQAQAVGDGTRSVGRGASGPSPAPVGRQGHWCQIALELAPGSESCLSISEAPVMSSLPLLPKATSSTCLLQTPRAWSSTSTWTGRGSTGEPLAGWDPSGCLGPPSLPLPLIQLWSLGPSPGFSFGCGLGGGPKSLGCLSRWSC